MQFIACMYGFSITKLSCVRDTWNVKESFLSSAHNFGEVLGMTYGSFDEVRKNIRFGPNHAEMKSYDEIDNLVVMFNDNMSRIFIPGGHVTVDESTSGWHGMTEKYPSGPPNLTKMLGKPESVSFMLKSIADAETRIICEFYLRAGPSYIALFASGTVIY
mmetsp:Transcript_80681/g.216239  ORF Transcript_80681/g.216239 Transcript_80681/m.216239 type:complete len:160 (+) Transcript_80681:435-914(+)